MGIILKPMTQAKHSMAQQADLGTHLCPVCNQTSKFRASGHSVRPNAKCLHCGAKERHRLVWLFLQRCTNLFNGEHKRLLHIAPERALGPRLQSILGNGYFSGDLNSPGAMVHFDITDTPFSDATFDAVYCSHVLEHVLDDRAGLGEIHRILKPGGWATVLVPISVPVTFEDPSITQPEDRLRLFGKADHVRRYGPDFKDRIVEAGFSVQCHQPSDFVTADEIVTMAIKPKESIFFCKKEE